MKIRHAGNPTGDIEYNTAQEWRTAFGPHNETQLVLLRDDCQEFWGYQFVMCDSVHSDCKFWWNGPLKDLRELAAKIIVLANEAEKVEKSKWTSNPR